MEGDAPIIRASRDDDVAAVAAIYGYHVRHGLASFEEEPPSVDEMARRRAGIVERGLPYLVAERRGQVVGYSYAGPFRPRIGYRYSLEDSIYVEEGQRGRGLGRALLAPLLEGCSKLGYRQMIAVIGGRETVASIRLHEALGFTQVGIFSGIGFKFGRWVDTVLMQRPLGPGADAPPG